MKQWIVDGMQAEKFPADQRDRDNWQVCILVKDGVLNLFERTPEPIIFEDAFFACGSGRDYAIAAMHLGKSAREAVEIASIYDTGCGNGVTELALCP